MDLKIVDVIQCVTFIIFWCPNYPISGHCEPFQIDSQVLLTLICKMEWCGERRPDVRGSTNSESRGMAARKLWVTKERSEISLKTCSKRSVTCSFLITLFFLNFSYPMSLNLPS